MTLWFYHTRIFRISCTVEW